MNNIINLKKRLGNFRLNVKIKLEDGINCFFGPSGSGKTSIINCIAGLIKPDYAEIVINNVVLNSSKDNYFCPIHNFQPWSQNNRRKKVSRRGSRKKLEF